MASDQALCALEAIDGSPSSSAVRYLRHASSASLVTLEVTAEIMKGTIVLGCDALRATMLPCGHQWSPTQLVSTTNRSTAG